jgi:hypothetical protein
MDFVFAQRRHWANRHCHPRGPVHSHSGQRKGRQRLGHLRANKTTEGQHGGHQGLTPLVYLTH